MNLKKFAVNPTAPLHLRDASDELMYADDEKTKPVIVTLYGPGSKQYAKAQAAKTNRLLDKLKRKGKSDQTAEEQALETAEFLADCVASWEGLEDERLSGRDLYISVFTDTEIGFVVDQVNKFVNDWANFKPNFTTN